MASSCMRKFAKFQNNKGKAMIGILASLARTVIGGVTDHFKDKRAIKKAIVENKIRLAESTQEYNAQWELKALAGKGWMDDVLFLAILAMYVYSAVDPEGAAKIFENWKVIPEWFQTVTMALVASIVGVRKLADYGPSLVKGVRDALK